MRRRLLDIFIAVSLLLCIATISLWTRSRWVADEVEWVLPGIDTWAWTPKGYLELGLFRGNFSGTFHQVRFGAARRSTGR